MKSKSKTDKIIRESLKGNPIQMYSQPQQFQNFAQWLCLSLCHLLANLNSLLLPSSTLTQEGELMDPVLSVNNWAMWLETALLLSQTIEEAVTSEEVAEEAMERNIRKRRETRT